MAAIAHPRTADVDRKDRVRGRAAMRRTGARGLAMAVIDDGKRRPRPRLGRPQRAGDPLRDRHDHVRRLADQGRLRLHGDAAGRGGEARSRPAAGRLSAAPAAGLRQSRRLRQLGRPRRRRALAPGDGAACAHPQRRLGQFLLVRAGRKLNSTSSRQPLRLFGRGIILLQFVSRKGSASISARRCSGGCSTASGWRTAA